MNKPMSLEELQARIIRIEQTLGLRDCSELDCEELKRLKTESGILTAKNILQKKTIQKQFEKTMEEIEAKENE